MRIKNVMELPLPHRAVALQQLTKKGSEPQLNHPPALKPSSPGSQQLKRQEDQLTKTELRYLRLLKVQREPLCRILIQAIRLNLGLTNLNYTPDFCVVRPDRTLEMHEVKGAHVYEDARVKFKQAVATYPMFYWVWAQWEQGQWRYQIVEPSETYGRIDRTSED